MGRLSWRRAAEITILAVGAAWLVSAVVLTGVWIGIDAVSSGSAVGYAFLAIILGFPMSVAVYVLGGALIVRWVAARCGVVLALGRSMLLQSVIGVGALLIGGVAASPTDSDAAFAVADAVATLLIAVPLVRWLAKPMAVATMPDW